MPISRTWVQGHATAAGIPAPDDLSTAECLCEEVASVTAALQGLILQRMTVNLREVKKLA